MKQKLQLLSGRKIRRGMRNKSVSSEVELGTGFSNPGEEGGILPPSKSVLNWLAGFVCVDRGSVVLAHSFFLSKDFWFPRYVEN